MFAGPLSSPGNVSYLGVSGPRHTLAGSTAGFADGAGLAAKFVYPHHVACDGAGDIYVADGSNNRVRRIKIRDGCCTVTTLAGNGEEGHRDGAGAQAQFNHPHGIAVDGDGNVIVGDSTGGVIHLITPEGMVSTLAGNRTDGFADGQGALAQFNEPRGIAVDTASL